MAKTPASNINETSLADTTSATPATPAAPEVQAAAPAVAAKPKSAFVEFCSEHKTAIAIGALTVVGAGVVYYVYRDSQNGVVGAGLPTDIIPAQGDVVTLG